MGGGCVYCWSFGRDLFSLGLESGGVMIAIVGFLLYFIISFEKVFLFFLFGSNPGSG